MYGDRIQPQIRMIEIEGRKIALMHEPQMIDALAQSGNLILSFMGILMRLIFAK